MTAEVVFKATLDHDTGIEVKGPDYLGGLFSFFVSTYGDQIAKACQITPTTEYQLSNFGLGSAWSYESPYTLCLEFYANFTTLVIKK